MFYISSHKYKGSVEVWGIMDTDDNVEEFYTKNMIVKFFEKGLKIEGLIHTGSSYKCNVTNLGIICMESLNKGEVFSINDSYMLYVGRDGLDNFICFDGTSIKKFTRKQILSDIYSISNNVIDSNKELALKKAFIKENPTSQLSYWLEKEINS